MNEPFTLRLVPPVHWGSPGATRAATRLASLDGLTIGLLSNGKPNGVELLDFVVEHWQAQHPGLRVIRHTKAHPSLPMSDEVLAMFAEHAHAVLTAVGD